jgi:hypothetical protein
LREAVGGGQVAFQGCGRGIGLLCRLMQLPELPTLKQFRYARSRRSTKRSGARDPQCLIRLATASGFYDKPASLFSTVAASTS